MSHIHQYLSVSADMFLAAHAAFPAIASGMVHPAVTVVPP